MASNTSCLLSRQIEDQQASRRALERRELLSQRTLRARYTARIAEEGRLHAHEFERRSGSSKCFGPLVELRGPPSPTVPRREPPPRAPGLPRFHHADLRPVASRRPPIPTAGRKLGAVGSSQQQTSLASLALTPETLSLTQTRSFDAGGGHSLMTSSMPSYPLGRIQSRPSWASLPNLHANHSHATRDPPQSAVQSAPRVLYAPMDAHTRGC